MVSDFNKVSANILLAVKSPANEASPVVESPKAVAAVAEHQVEWLWVKGHSGHRENEMVDQAANDAIDIMQAQ